MSQSPFVPRDDLDWEPDAFRYGAGEAWVRFAEWQIGFRLFFDANTDGFDFGFDRRVAAGHGNDRLRRWLIDQINQRLPLAQLRAEAQP